MDDVVSIVGIEDLTTIEANESYYTKTQSYSKENIETILNHILSKQKQFIGGSYININDILVECKKFGFNVTSEGKSIDE